MEKKSIEVYMCSTSVHHELGHGDPGPWKIYLTPEEITCCRTDDIEVSYTCCPVKMTLTWEE